MPAKRGRSIGNFGFQLFSGLSGGVTFVPPPILRIVDIAFELTGRGVNFGLRKREVDFTVKQRDIDFHLN